MASETDTETDTDPTPADWRGTTPAMADFLLTFEQVGRDAIDGIHNSEHQQDFFSGSTYGNE